MTYNDPFDDFEDDFFSEFNLANDELLSDDDIYMSIQYDETEDVDEYNQ